MTNREVLVLERAGAGAAVTFTRRQTSEGRVRVHVTDCVLVGSHPVIVLPGTVSNNNH